MILFEFPEIKLARRVLKKHSLIPPFNVRNLLESYATVIFKSIPIPGVDGIAVNIKVPGKKPLIIINQDVSPTRQQFTMAHELGHLIIPWHTGIKIDSAENDNELIYSEYIYSALEGEANRFAAELLMPSTYIRETELNNSSLAAAHEEICRQLTVSPNAAAIQMGKTLPAGIIYSAVRNGVVEYSGRTEGTFTTPPAKSQLFNEKLYLSAQEHSIWNVKNLSIHWWKMASSLSLDATYDDRSWRELLDEIVLSINPEQGSIKYKQSLNGVIGSINSKMRHSDNYTFESLLAACYQRFENEDYAQLKNHRNFNAFLKKRVEEMFSNRK